MSWPPVILHKNTVTEMLGQFITRLLDSNVYSDIYLTGIS
mgnify:CR=1 FL=1